MTQQKVSTTQQGPQTLKEFLKARDVRLDAVALMAGVDKASVSRIVNGHTRPRPETVVKLARALGTSARRMQAMVEASWQAAHPQGVDDAAA